MPYVIVVLGVAVFAQGTSEFMLSGLIEPIAAEVGVSLGAAGLLTSLFAVGMLVGAPLTAMAAGRWPARFALTGCLAMFLAAHVIGAVTTTFGILLATRVVAAVANAGFLAVALAVLPILVGPHRVGRATSVILSGVTLACVVGVPAGAFLGQLLGWRSAFWAVVIVSVPALVGIWLLVPNSPSSAEQTGSLWSEWRALGLRRVRSALMLGGAVNAATFAAFTYLGVLTTDIGEPAWTPMVLALFGIGSFVGVTLAGRYADRYAPIIRTAGSVVLLGVWITAALTAGSLPALLIMAMICGATSFAVGSTVIALIISAASPTAPHLSGAFATTAFNVGAALGPATAGLAISATQSTTAALWTSTVFAAAALFITTITRRSRPRALSPGRETSPRR
ncbi:DHA1 family chloramphenicol resistance protein-like MFS transporter [Nocardia tenerifensis]|uniref:DHA1 family chloramphenicol resistance protein-like MFS transporter n=1 Tax=Nocardia tenerifensis TaxID=228006 RepID=A0A318JZA8_9NOCA|nr:Cmx/CmrA family chloramphenicol efflux MFS transporter [Nocardia tenerifensis]PXX64072.1 DHA1 family chloramphenicol resistance protein-like MFS transporter [Nocardia tenerifensis]